MLPDAQRHTAAPEAQPAALQAAHERGLGV